MAYSVLKKLCSTQMDETKRKAVRLIADGQLRPAVVIY